MLRLFTLIFILFSISANANITTCSIPLDESKSAPAIDLIQNKMLVDRDVLFEQIRQDFDSSVLEPELNDFYLGSPQPLVQYPDTPFPAEGDTVNFTSPLPSITLIARGRVTLEKNPKAAFQLIFSLDQHASLARNAFLRRLGYAIPTPKHYFRLKVRFNSREEKDEMLSMAGGTAGGERGTWLEGGDEEAYSDHLVVTLRDVILEPAIIDTVPLHWAVLSSKSINSRRSLRSLIVPFTLLDIPENVNQYSFEAAKINNENIDFSRVSAENFNNDVSIGDVKWILNKIASLTRDDWTAIIQAGLYPKDVQTLITEKTIGRVNQLMKILGVKGFKPLPYDENISIGSIVNGKATKQNYDGYVLNFSSGDPLSPLRASEIARFFSLELVNGGLSYLIDKVNHYLNFVTPERYVKQYGDKLFNDLVDHVKNYPNDPYIQPISVFGGPTASGNINASRNVVTGTYYGSNSPIQLVDSLSASVGVGGFFGVAGIHNLGLSFGPSVRYSRTYVHVRPLSDIKSALQDNWKNLMVPYFMSKLAKVIAGGTSIESSAAIEQFIESMKDGEIFIVTDGLSAGGTANANIPLGAVLGLLAPYSGLSADVGLSSQYAVLSRVTLTKTDKGLQVYLSRIHSGSFQAEIDANFFINVLSLTEAISKGAAHTRAYIFPEKFNTPDENKKFQDSILQILRRNNPHQLEASFKPYEIDHHTKGNRFRIAIGPWSWSKRENIHKLEITPPIDLENRYRAEDFKRTIIQGQITQINGTNFFGFFSGLLRKIVPFINLGGTTRGDDPSSSFLGKSKTFTVNTEIELTPTQFNNPFTQIQHKFSGWILGKNRLLRILKDLSDQLEEFNLNGELINPSEFSQTKKIEAFSILWNMLVYEKGTKNVLNILNANLTSTKNAQDFMIKLMGKNNYDAFCSQNNLEPTLTAGPLDDPNDEGTRIESSKGQTTLIGCITPFMDTLYNLRESLSGRPNVFSDSVRTEEEAKEKIKWTNRVFLELNSNLSLAQIIRWVGKENSFFQIKVTGFRTHDENAKIQPSYFSNTIGLVNQEILSGPTSGLEYSTGLTSYEIEARYLSDGY